MMVFNKRDEKLKTEDEIRREDEIRKEKARKERDANPDPITGEPGSHPVGTGIGSATVGTVGAAVGGAVGGPVGSVAGAAIGAIVGGLAGHGAGEAVNPTEEHDYWTENYRSRPYVDKEAAYAEYAPAYEYGYMAQGRYQGKTFEQAEPDLEKEWEANREDCELNWSEARPAVRESWERVAMRQRQSELSITGNEDGQ